MKTEITDAFSLEGLIPFFPEIPCKKTRTKRMKTRVFMVVFVWLISQFKELIF
jgi:hypothetical protein